MRWKIATEEALLSRRSCWLLALGGWSTMLFWDEANCPSHWSWSLLTELADLMMVASKEWKCHYSPWTEGACGEDPLDLGINGHRLALSQSLIKANMPSRVLLHEEKAIIWDRLHGPSWMKMALKLLSRRDILFKPIDENLLIHLQGSLYLEWRCGRIVGTSEEQAKRWWCLWSGASPGQTLMEVWVKRHQTRVILSLKRPKAQSSRPKSHILPIDQRVAFPWLVLTGQIYLIRKVGLSQAMWWTSWRDQTQESIANNHTVREKGTCPTSLFFIENRK